MERYILTLQCCLRPVFSFLRCQRYLKRDKRKDAKRRDYGKARHYGSGLWLPICDGWDLVECVKIRLRNKTKLSKQATRSRPTRVTDRPKWANRPCGADRPNWAEQQIGVGKRVTLVKRSGLHQDTATTVFGRMVAEVLWAHISDRMY